MPPSKHYRCAKHLLRVHIAGACCLIGLLSIRAYCDTALVAIAANFAETASDLASCFERESRHELSLTIGSTGKFYAQIRHGAPFDLLLSADAERPGLLVQNRLAIAESRRTYAIGRLALWSLDADQIHGNGDRLLREGRFDRLAIANPRLAPYGNAAVETLTALGVYPSLRRKLVLGDNVAQAYALVRSGNAELGLISLASLNRKLRDPRGSYWEVPASLHAPIRQDAVLLAHGSSNPAAVGFINFLTSPTGREIIRAHGYRLP